MNNSTTKTDDRLEITYRNGYQSLRLLYSADLESATFVALDDHFNLQEVIEAALDAGGSDFEHDGVTWTASIS